MTFIYSGDYFYFILIISMISGMVVATIAMGLAEFVAEFVRRLQIKIKRQKGGKI